MKTTSRFAVSSLAAALLLAVAPIAQAQRGYQPGQVVSTNFALVNRYLWTNDTGRVFTPGDSLIRLGDFDGRIVFFELFAVW
jgi:hypothetical protein